MFDFTARKKSANNSRPFIHISFLWKQDYIIPANTYPGQTEDVTTIGVKAVLVTTDAVSTETIHQITQLLFHEASTLQYAISLDLQVDEENALQNITVPIHNGALAYYEEQGITLTPSE